MSEMLHSKRVANLLGATETSVITGLKEGRFEQTETGETGAGIPKYYISAEDPTLKELMAGLERGDSIPSWLEPRAPKPKKGKKGRGGGNNASPAADPLGLATPESEIRRGSSKIQRDFGKRQGFKTKVYREKEDGNRSFVTTRPGLIEPEFLQEMFPEGGDFYLVVYRRLSNGEWDYVPDLSRDDEPFSVDPMPGFEDDLQEADLPRGHDPDADFVRGIARSAFDKRLNSPGDNGATQAIASMQGNITQILSGMISTNNNTFQQMMNMSQTNHERTMEAMTKREEAREKERAHEREMAEKAHKADLDRLREEAKARESDREAEHRRRMDEIERNHKLEMERQKADALERERRDKEWTKALQDGKDAVLTKIHEMDVESREGLKEQVKESLETHERFFAETQRHLEEEFQLRASMVPTQIWADALKGIGERLSTNFPQIMSAIQNQNPQAGAIAGAVPVATQPGQTNTNTGVGGKPMGVNILNQIKGDPNTAGMLKELLEDMAKFIEQDEPPAFYAQKLLTMVSTVPGFATALTELYMTEMEVILKGILDTGAAREIILSEKGKTFWAALRKFIKDYYVQMQNAGGAAMQG